jgi:hypothetical protein
MTTIVTGSPIEGHIIAVFMKAQITTAAFLTGTPIFRGLLFVALTWVVLHQFLQIGMNRNQANQAVVTIVYRVGMVVLALSLLNNPNTGVIFASVDGPWSNYTMVSSDTTRYGATLNGTPQSLWAYGMLHQALNEVAQGSAKTAADAFADPSLDGNPLFLTQQLARMATFTLGPDKEAEFVALIRQCGNPDAGAIAGDAATSISAMLDLSGQDCRDLWNHFHDNATAEGRRLFEQFPPKIQQHVLDEIKARYPTIQDEDAIGNIAMAWAINRAAMDLLSVKRAKARGEQPVPDATETEAGAGGASPSLAPDVGNSYLEQYAIINSLGRYAPEAGDPAAKGWKTLSRQFEDVAPYIPVARGYIQGVLAILFVFAVYSLGFGTWRFMRMWLLAEATICLYRPIALVGYKAAEYFFLEEKMANALKAASTDGLVIGGAQILSEQLSRIQTVYVAFELGAFFVFCIGAIRVFQPLGHLAMNFGAMALQGMPNLAPTGGGASAPAATSAPAAASPVAAPAMMASFGRPVGGGTYAEPPAVVGTGIQSSSSAPPSTWEGSA